MNSSSTDYRDFFSVESCEEDGIRARQAAGMVLSEAWEQVGPTTFGEADELRGDICVNEDTVPPPPPENPVHRGECSGDSRSLPDSCYGADSCYNIIQFVKKD